MIPPAASLAAVILLSASPARAQFVFDDAILPPRVVAWRLADRGFTPLGRPRFDGRSYVVEAVGPGGGRVRLFVDPEDGAIVARQRLDPPMIAYNRPAAPGYGWTEEDARVPPPGAGIGGAVRPRTEPRPPGTAYGPATDGIDGLNPERGAKPEPARRAARLSVPEKPRPAARTVPDAPRTGVPEAARPEPAASEPAKVETRSPAPGATPEPTARPDAAGAAAAPKAPEATRKAEATWQDPPADGSRKVRVIGGATVVPGQTDKAADKEPGVR